MCEKCAVSLFVCYNRDIGGLVKDVKTAMDECGCRITKPPLSLIDKVVVWKPTGLLRCSKDRCEDYFRASTAPLSYVLHLCWRSLMELSSTPTEGPCCHDNSRNECVKVLLISLPFGRLLKSFSLWHVCRTWTTWKRTSFMPLSSLWTVFTVWAHQLLNVSLSLCHSASEAHYFQLKSIASWYINRLQFKHKPNRVPRCRLKIMEVFLWKSCTERKKWKSTSLRISRWTKKKIHWIDVVFGSSVLAVTCVLYLLWCRGPCSTLKVWSRSGSQYSVSWGATLAAMILKSVFMLQPEAYKHTFFFCFFQHHRLLRPLCV